MTTDLFGHQLLDAGPGYIEVTCEWRSETRDAIAVVNGKSELQLDHGRESWTWLPKSAVKAMRREGRKIAVLTIHERLAREKGLL